MAPIDPPSDAPQPHRVVSRASFGRRFGAFLIDGIIFAVPTWIIAIVLGETLPRGEIEVCEDGNDVYLCQQFTGAGMAVFIGFFALLFLVLIVGYHGMLQGRRGATWGKRAVNIKVVRRGTDDPIGMGRGIGRFFASYLSALPCYLGYFWMLWDKGDQTWHDKMTDAEVIDL